MSLVAVLLLGSFGATVSPLYIAFPLHVLADGNLLESRVSSVRRQVGDESLGEKMSQNYAGAENFHLR